MAPSLRSARGPKRVGHADAVRSRGVATFGDTKAATPTITAHCPGGAPASIAPSATQSGLVTPSHAVNGAVNTLTAHPSSGFADATLQAKK